MIDVQIQCFLTNGNKGISGVGGEVFVIISNSNSILNDFEPTTVKLHLFVFMFVFVGMLQGSAGFEGMTFSFCDLEDFSSLTFCVHLTG